MILSEIVKERKGRFLMLGYCADALGLLKVARWTGLAVCPNWGKLSDDDYYGEITYIDGQLYQENHFQRNMDGVWFKPLTVQDVFMQWGGWYFDIILIDVPMFTRLLWYTPQLQDHLPRYYILKDDGHNAALMDQAKDRGYFCFLDGEWLVLRHRRAMEDEILTEKEKRA